LNRLAKEHSWKVTTDVKPVQVEGLRIGQRRAVLALLRFAARLDQPLDPRALRTEPPRRPRRAKPPLLTDLQVGALLANASLLGGPSAAAYGHLLATYGHRPESLAKLTVAALQGDSLALPVKGGDDIRHPLLPESLALLRPLVEGRSPTAPLFLDHHGEPWGTGQRFADWWWKKVAPILKEPSLRGVYHLKRFAITRMLGLGLDVATIASLTGHRTPSVILTYARTNEERQTAALTALRGLHSAHGGMRVIPPGAPREHQDKS
jgi:integrase